MCIRDRSCILDAPSARLILIAVFSSEDAALPCTTPDSCSIPWPICSKDSAWELAFSMVFSSSSAKDSKMCIRDSLWTAQTRNLLRCCLLQLRGIKIRDRTFYKILQRETNKRKVGMDESCSIQAPSFSCIKKNETTEVAS